MSKEQWGHGYWKGVKDGLRMHVDFKAYCVQLYNNECIRSDLCDEDAFISDFAYDVSRDKEFPVMEHGESYRKYKKRIYDHMHGTINGRRSNPCKEAEWAFRHLWNEWLRLHRGVVLR